MIHAVGGIRGDDDVPDMALFRASKSDEFKSDNCVRSDAYLFAMYVRTTARLIKPNTDLRNHTQICIPRFFLALGIFQTNDTTLPLKIGL
jgi:hypothetical protein